MPDRTIKRNDTGPPVTATLTDANGAINLTNATSVKFLMQSIGDEIDPAVTRSGNCDFVDRTLGKVRYAWAAIDTSVAATYNVEFEIVWADGTKWTVPNDSYKSVEIKPDLG